MTKKAEAGACFPPHVLFKFWLEEVERHAFCCWRNSVVEGQDALHQIIMLSCRRALCWTAWNLHSDKRSLRTMQISVNHVYIMPGPCHHHEARRLWVVKRPQQLLSSATGWPAGDAIPAALSGHDRQPPTAGHLQDSQPNHPLHPPISR